MTQEEQQLSVIPKFQTQDSECGFLTFGWGEKFINGELLVKNLGDTPMTITLRSEGAVEIEGRIVDRSPISFVQEDFEKPSEQCFEPTLILTLGPKECSYSRVYLDFLNVDPEVMSSDQMRQRRKYFVIFGNKWVGFFTGRIIVESADGEKKEVPLEITIL